MRSLLVAVLARTPLGLANVIAWAVAWTWWWVVPIRRREAVEALTQALPGVAPRAVLTRMMHDIALSYVELLQLARVEFVFEGLEGLPAGALLLAGHGGAWDASLLALADRVKVAAFLRRPSDPWTHAFIAEHRRRHDLLALETGARMEDAYAAIEAGRVVLFIQDQRHARGIWSRFFGRPARTSAGLAAAHLKTGRPIWAVWQWREGVGRHRVRLAPLALPPLTGDRDADTQAITDVGNRWYEDNIRAYPHGWLWLHRRWR